MRTAGMAAKTVAPVVLPIRLRYVLLMGVLVVAVWQLVPRAVAAWRLHTLATTFADYALCMAGPTGPTELRDNPSEFWRTVRRRLVTSPADSRPFSSCATAAEEITDSIEIGRAHDARSRDFVEYGADAADRAARSKQRELGLGDLGVSTHPLSLLAKAARPFVRQGYTQLVVPSMNAALVTHPAELPLPVAGRGLPEWRTIYRAVTELDGGGFMLAVGHDRTLSAYRSVDGGVNWEPASIQDPRALGIAGRCFGSDPARAFTVSVDGDSLQVTSRVSDREAQTTALANGWTRILGMACDDTALVVALGKKRIERVTGDHEVELFLCAHDGSCKSLPQPALGQGLSLQSPLDVARVAGTTVIALTRHGIVRTASSRDDGATWTPFIVAFDRGAYPGLRVEVGVPDHLLALKNQLILYAGSPKPGMTYPVLTSDNLGASWRTPTVTRSTP